VKLTHLPILLILLLLLSGCERQESGASSATKSSAPATQQLDQARLVNNQTAPGQQVSLDQASNSQAMAEAMNRKIIRNGELTLEVADPQDAQRKISSTAETLGGFVVTSEAKQRRAADGASEQLEVNLVVRVPATQFGPAMDQIRSAGGRVLAEKETGQDVTEEFIDLEAHIKTQKALEDKFLEIMKRASKVEEALEVERQIAEVRTEIEKLEGRKRFLENRASLSTITVSLQNPTAIAVNTTGFGRDIRQAVADSVQVAIAIVLFLIRFVIVMIPIFILLILPIWLVGRYFWRRAMKLGSKSAPADSQPVPTPESKSD
jgi:hypothetical protein